MANDNQAGGRTFLAIVLGGIVLALVIAAYFMYGHKAEAPAPAPEPPKAEAPAPAPAPEPTPAPTPAPTLGEMTQWFKTMTTNEYIRGVKTLQWTPFPGKLWQRNYYEHIIRNERECDAIARYIRDNPTHWADDPDNPMNPVAPPHDYWREAGL